MAEKHPSKDPFQADREQSGTLTCTYQEESIPLLLRHSDVKKAAKDWQTFSSDAPFRVPIPSEEKVRTVRQLPIETNPPEHSEYRKIVEPYFRRPKDADFQKKVSDLLNELLDRAFSADEIEVVNEFALPLQSRALTYLLNVPESEADEWISWGVNVLRDKELSEEKGARLECYIHRQLDRAQSQPGEDLFSTLTQAEFRGKKLSREEMVGFANLVFAGGRDTIIHSVSSILGYLAEHPSTLDQLRENPKLIFSATEEFMRYFSPLTHLGRVCPVDTKVGEHSVTADDRIGLCWSSANRDVKVFEHPDEVQLDRRPNPHVAFGIGPHNCLGALHTRVLVRTLLQLMVERVDHMKVISKEDHVEVASHYQRILGYEYLTMKIYENRA